MARRRERELKEVMGLRLSRGKWENKKRAEKRREVGKGRRETTAVC